MNNMATARVRDFDSDPIDSSASLDAFYAGNKEVMTIVYREHFTAVDRAIGRILSPVDKETVVHEVFFRLLTDAELRLHFSGGSMRAWLVTLGRNLAIDYARRQAKEQLLEDDLTGAPGTATAADRDVEARLLVESFRRHHLPKKWAGVFELRFLRQLDQDSAARELGIARTTVAYRECRIRRLLRRFLLIA
jgi:RNA polymerase sigma-70 factor (ECF subfamily)